MIKHKPPFFFLSLASYFSALSSLFLLNLMFTVQHFHGKELLLTTAVLAIKNPVFFCLTLPWWGSMVSYWRGKLTILGMAFLIFGLLYYVVAIINILSVKLAYFSTYLFIVAWGVGALGALLLPLVLQFSLTGKLSPATTKKIGAVINLLSAITFAALIFSIRVA